MRRLFGVFVWPMLLTYLAGCAHVVVDSDGTRHLTGFVVMTLPTVLPDVGADAVRMRSIGLTVTGGHAATSQVTLGYSDTTIVVMRNDSVISRTALRHVLKEELTPKEE
jgi:hypothetical protein